MVQVKETLPPVRTAVRLVTGTGSLSVGGKGAPGVPQPAIARATAKTNAPLDRTSIVLIARWDTV
jgi:hypothetical protein